MVFCKPVEPLHLSFKAPEAADDTSVLNSDESSDDDVPLSQYSPEKGKKRAAKASKKSTVSRFVYLLYMQIIMYTSIQTKPVKSTGSHLETTGLCQGFKGIYPPSLVRYSLALYNAMSALKQDYW